MAYRFTNTDKWSDAWFSQLRPMQKLLFIYLCDNCDIAGFIEVNHRRWAADLNTDIKTIEGATEGLQRGFKYSTSGDCMFIRNFLKHQKNWPLDIDRNPAHRGIYKRFELYFSKFDCLAIDDLIKAPSEGLQRGLGNNKGISIDISSISTIEERQQNFKNEIEQIAESKSYTSDMLTSFYAYWSEPNRSRTKMKCEMQKTWDTARRLTTWAGNEKKFKR